MKNLSEKIKSIFLLLILEWVLFKARFEFHEIAWGTGKWYGEFSLTWYVLYLSFSLFVIAIFLLTALFLFRRELFSSLMDKLVSARNRLGNFRWILWLFFLLLPVYFFQYSVWGLVFHKTYIRILTWLLVVFFLTILSSSKSQLADWKAFLSSLVLTASAFSIAVSLKDVYDYPFSLGWSEGNRLWDYSILFGSARYDYPADQQIPVLLDFGRQFVGGLPFLFPQLTITMERLWVGLTFVIPYFLLGLAAFREEAKNRSLFLILLFYVFLFLKQGPIHPPLLLCAALVALAWRMPLGFSIPLVVGAGYFAQASRFSWTFAPAIWIVMLEFASASFSDRKSAVTAWMRSATLGVSGIFGGFLLPKILSILTIATSSASPSSSDLVEQVTEAGLTSETIVQQVTKQPLLWYRLLPNSTYDKGILLALILTVGALLVLWIYAASQKVWKLNNLQKLSIILPSLAFLTVGLIASTKIGGGGDLHNMDMFLIGLLFTGILAWRAGAKEWILDPTSLPFVMKVLVIFMLANSSLTPLLEMRSRAFGEEIIWLRTLRDAPYNATLEMLPTRSESSQAIQTIQQEVDRAKIKGEVLFIDQRQLLTFGYIKNVPFVPEYEKKILMNQALASDDLFFQGFYEDLASQRFSLIISEPLRTPIQDDSFQFGEENNAWVQWVSIPVLCYYDQLETLKIVNVQLLTPKPIVEDCSTLPGH